jgi:hypothetical protein
VRSTRGSAASLAILAMALAGCGTVGTLAGASSTASDQAVLQRALAAWADFRQLRTSAYRVRSHRTRRARLRLLPEEMRLPRALTIGPTSGQEDVET